MASTKNDYNAVDWKSKVRYEPSSPTGLVWITKTLRGPGKRFNNVAGSYTHKSWRVSLGGISYSCSRVIVILRDGYLPQELVVDHLDGNCHNNLIENLAVKTHQENNQNTRMSPKNKTGVTGVFLWDDKRLSGPSAYVAVWNDISGKQRRKFFAFSKYTEQGALEAAAEFRRNMIQKLIDQGMAYTSRHGEK